MSPAPGAGPPAPLAAIDVGTNSIRLVVAQPEPDGTYRVLDEERVVTRLGQGLHRTGRLADESYGRSLEALGKMKAIADGFGVSELRTVATSAVREAENGPLFRREAWKRHRVRVDVISSDDEARFAFESAARRFPLEGRASAIVDIGGGSVEVMLAAGTVVENVFSLPLGAVVLSERFCQTDRIGEREWRALRRYIDETLRTVIGKPPFAPEVMIGSGGTFSALAQIVRYEREGREGTAQGYVMTRAEATRVLARLLEVPLAQRRNLPGLPPGRADIIVAGAAVVARLAKHLGIRQILVNDGGVRDGVLLSMIADLPGPHPVPTPTSGGRLDAVRAFARKCRSNERHCEHVGLLAGEIFDGVREAFRLPESARELLLAAALLHDIGFLVNHAKHHKHAYHLIMHSDLAGYSAHDVEVIANVARYHRRAFPKKSHANFRRLDKADRRLVRRLAGILRVAVALDRTHTQIVSGVRCMVKKRRVRLTLLTTSDPSVELWDARRKAALFEKAFGVELKFIRRVAGGRPAIHVVRGAARRAAGS